MSDNAATITHAGSVDIGGGHAVVAIAIVLAAWILAAHWADATRDAARINACRDTIPLRYADELPPDATTSGQLLNACVKAARPDR